MNCSIWSCWLVFVECPEAAETTLWLHNGITWADISVMLLAMATEEAEDGV